MTIQNFDNQKIDCYTQEESQIRENCCMTGILSKTRTGFRFEEEVKTTKPHTRNPKIFEQKHISVVRRSDNTLKFSFKELKPNFDAERFACEVYQEILDALKTII